MLKIVPAVMITAIVGLISVSSQAQGPRNPHHSGTTVIVIDDDDDWHDRGPNHKKYRKGKHSRYREHPGNRRGRISHPPLVIMDTRHLPIRKYSNNRYYYRTQAGLHYWLGRNGNLYLDVKFVNRNQCNDREYAYWERGYGW
jgi:hypothetical protein